MLKPVQDYKVTQERNSKEIPLTRLGKDNPILQYGEVSFFEDEFGDKGYCRANVRYRVMDDCFFVLLRSYVRID